MITWEEYFMGIAKLSAQRSKDPHTQVGAVIVDSNNKIVSIGYNGMPRGCQDYDFSWEVPEKYLYVVHAELNAILNYKGESLEGARMYVTHFPCNECVKAIIQAGIKEIIYENESKKTEPAIKMLDYVGVKYRQC